ncbi:hypothetical protein [Serratia marcescens]|uniref:hypothetical protein n=1 Tax=Serratia marcescens TaxID=615 RepID=UPI0012FD3564|nr:hypothetical protein [Serratia marcescens]
MTTFTGVVWVSGANLYLTPEDSRKEPYLMALLNGAPETFHYPNPQKSENRKRSGRSDSGRKTNNIITLSDYRPRKLEKL